MTRRRYYLAAGIFIFAVTAFLIWFYLLRGKVDEGILEANGQVRGTEITVSSKVAGRIVSLRVKEGEAVKDGDPIAKISSKEIEAVLAQAKARMEASRNRLKEIEASLKATGTAIEQAKISAEFAKESSFHSIHRARAGLERAGADIKDAESQWELAKKDYERYSRLLKEEVVSQSQFDEVESRFNAAEARLNAAKKAREEALAALQSAEATALEVQAKEKEHQRLLDERERLKASYGTAQSQLDEAEAKVKEVSATYGETWVYAPSAGTVINKLTEEGELVNEGTPVVTLIDLTDIYVRVFIPERDIGKVRLNDPARIYTDAFPGRFFGGRLTEVSQKAEFTPKEVHMKEERTKLVFGVKVGIENPEGYLKPGMPVDVRIKWKEDAGW